MQTAPKWFKPVAIVALLWNALGCAAYLSDVMLTPEDLAAMSTADQAIYAARPAWAVAASAFAVWGGALGSIGLILRKRWATPVLIVSLAGVTFGPALGPLAPAQNQDWASLGRYQQDNARLSRPQPGEHRVVFYGDSITDAWAAHFAAMFPGKPYVGRGISGQTTPQMLVRFRQDVIALDPAVVVILAGTNDIAGNTGPSTQVMIEDNLVSMVEIARANGIRVVLSSVLPATAYRWRPGIEPGPKIVALNAWMKQYCAENDVVYLDYHSAMADQHQGLGQELSGDGVHPNEAGYRLMAPMAERAIAEALRGR